MDEKAKGKVKGKVREKKTEKRKREIVYSKPNPFAKKSDAERRTIGVLLKFSQREMRILAPLVKASGKKRAEYIRFRCLGG